MSLVTSKPKRDEVINHWIAFADGFTLSPAEFYAALQKELTIREIPGLEISRIDYPEGGLLSEKRVYLRLIRERLAFDTCAAPFGTGCFFSCRTIYSPPILKFWHFVAVLLLLNVIGSALVQLLGRDFALIAEVGLVLAIALVFRRTVASALSDLDALLLKIPAIGPIYDRWFRKDTYYRQDARMVYLDVVSTVFKELAQEMAADKGVKLVRQYERAPVLGDLYKHVPPTSEELSV